ncbi:hypothetical protein BOX15_Mlig002993g2 [Macrostomum lignano]|uniref:Uncharacterized protein n=2 Tax=Macrostomum lignano TaxID=282301 RepID=A0A267GSR7_9PLAT|nr:hypothetical protein BOX15_Mlig002993g3 [Macrostomum lignano]PAA67073.1 hypothetical protein BOX15_Mlig002993g1 [Macrostomum lignano]PAA89045.1 hypothetical protein BOX15_Mlig002993g2 [Macrostomum lignano]
MSSQQNVYGAGPTVGLNYTFDPVLFLKQPTTIVRIISWIFSIIVFGCISSGCYVESICIFNFDANACAYGLIVGVVAFLASMGFLVMDALFPRLSSAQIRKYVVLADAIFSAVWAFFYFVAFCYLTNRLASLPDSFAALLSIQQWQFNNARASVAFCFLSIVSFGLLVFFAVQKYRQGQQEAFPAAAQVESEVASQQPPTRPDSNYQQPPFSFGGAAADIDDQHRQPTY